MVCGCVGARVCGCVCLCMCMCVCVCVCERKRKRESVQRHIVGLAAPLLSPVLYMSGCVCVCVHVCVVVCVYVCVCVCGCVCVCERERDIVCATSYRRSCSSSAVTCIVHVCV